MTTLIIIDNSGREYEVKDPQIFFDHLIDYHSNNNVGDHSTTKKMDIILLLRKNYSKK